uniref:I/LWEQ domain-containing protein n=2 Tax=Timema TaxID=61471 RepID=A0A7R9G1N1_TIMSH|nr:unnamed protein product [Timema shepardi]
MSVEMFDYMDNILELQTSIFGSLDMSRSNSMTSCGQCRLAPLIPCIQDSSQLYDYCVKILFKLHASLPPDILIGHRERFLKQFKELRQFYINASTMQYFKTLIQIPLLPDVSSVACSFPILPDKPPNFLIQAELRSYVTPVVILPAEEPSPPESDAVDGTLIDTSDSGSTGEFVDFNHHQNGSISPDILAERDSLIEQLQMEMGRLRSEIQRLQRVVEQLHDKIGDLETQLATKDSELLQEKQLKDDLMQQTVVMSRYQETEEVKEGFGNQINLCRDRGLNPGPQHRSPADTLPLENQVIEEKFKTVDGKFQKLKEVYTKLRDEHVQLIRQKASLEKELKLADKMTVFAQAANNFITSICVHVSVRDPQKADVVKQLEGDRLLAQSVQASMEAKLREITVEKSRAQETLQKSSALEGELEILRAAQEAARTETLVSSRRAEAIVQKSIEDVDNPALSAVKCSPDYFRSLTEPVLKLLDEVDSSFHDFNGDSSSSTIEPLVQSVGQMAHSLANYLLHGKATSNISPDIEFGESIEEVCKLVGSDAVILLRNMKDRSKAADVPGNVAAAKARVGQVDALVEKLMARLQGDTKEIIGDLVEDELASMDKAIEEAANRIEDMLRKSRAADSGIKLEVNEKILDSCTNLMRAIRELVKKSRLLQAEIVLQGKGTASATEFYKRNHQWTEGLISAAKAVGMGAKFLLTAADKVVRGEGKFEQLMVASQEIAASTAQLVVASRVKAERNSANLGALSLASKGVTQATGVVVATSKSCSEMVEESEDLDVSGLSLHQAKRLEMESQVRVLELEANLQKERERLATLRRRHYRLAGELEGWEQQIFTKQFLDYYLLLGSHFRPPGNNNPNHKASVAVLEIQQPISYYLFPLALLSRGFVSYIR